MRHLTIIILSIPFCSFCYSQHNAVIRDDSLFVKFNRTFLFSNNIKKQVRSLNILLQYDYKFQYPYYKVASNQIGLNNEVIINLSHTPKQGFIYFFTEDDMNNFANLKVIRCDSLLGTKTISISIFPKKEKLEYINLWYSDVELNDFNNLLKSLQYTMGDYIQRTVYFLDEKLIAPNRFWNFNENLPGITFENSITNKRFVLPIIIKLK